MFLWYNDGMEDLRAVVAQNLAQCRKSAGLTQLQLAEKLNYTDKAVSKWERGESLPDLTVLVALSELYGVSVDYFVSEHKKPPIAPQKRNRRRIVFALCGIGIIWFVATALYAILYVSGLSGERIWLSFVYAIPASFILLVVFSAVWWNRYVTFASVSLLLWSVPLALWLTIEAGGTWLLFAVAAPLQALAVFWFLLRQRKSK